jgi:hypothetical protein
MTNTDTIVSKPGFLTITHKENPSYIYFAWENFGISLDDCVDAFARAEKAMVERGVFHIITDTANVKQPLRPEVAKWWGEVCMPSLARCGVKLIVSVVPASEAAQLSTRSSPTEVVNNIVMQKAPSVSEAESLLRARHG